MEIRIGIHNTPRELTLESSQSAADVQQAVSAAVADAAGVLTLADDKGRIVLVPASTLAYVEISGNGPRKVGFGI